METADSCRRAASEAVANVEPPRLHELIESTLDGASMVPGALTIESATAIAADRGNALEFEYDHDQPSGAASDRDDDAVVTHAAGVQLIYEGLRLTRSLAHEEPWTDPDATADGDLEILAADILVARGFYLLAHTDAAGKAVRTVQAFGRDQTLRDDSNTDGREPGADDPASLDANLEGDILELAVLTGAAAVGETPTPRLLALADDLAETETVPFPPAEEYLSGLEPSLSDRALDEQNRTTDRATSATDP